MIFVEGKPDQLLLRALGFVKSEVKIAGSKGKVCNELRKRNNVAGMMDEDPEDASPGYFRELVVIYEDRSIIELKDNARNNRVAIIRPYFEEWLVRSCERFNVSLQEYFLPMTARELKKVINYRLEKLENLIIENGNIETLTRLKRYFTR